MSIFRLKQFVPLERIAVPNLGNKFSNCDLNGSQSRLVESIGKKKDKTIINLAGNSSKLQLRNHRYDHEFVQFKPIDLQDRPEAAQMDKHYDKLANDVLEAAASNLSISSRLLRKKESMQVKLRELENLKNSNLDYQATFKTLIENKKFKLLRNLSLHYSQITPIKQSSSKFASGADVAELEPPILNELLKEAIRTNNPKIITTKLQNHLGDSEFYTLMIQFLLSQDNLDLSLKVLEKKRLLYSIEVLDLHQVISYILLETKKSDKKIDILNTYLSEYTSSFKFTLKLMKELLTFYRKEGLPLINDFTIPYLANQGFQALLLPHLDSKYKITMILNLLIAHNVKVANCFANQYIQKYLQSSVEASNDKSLDSRSIRHKNFCKKSINAMTLAPIFDNIQNLINEHDVTLENDTAEIILTVFSTTSTTLDLIMKNKTKTLSRKICAIAIQNIKLPRNESVMSFLGHVIIQKKYLGLWHSFFNHSTINTVLEFHEYIDQPTLLIFCRRDRWRRIGDVLKIILKRDGLIGKGLLLESLGPIGNRYTTTNENEPVGDYNRRNEIADIVDFISLP